MANGVVGAIDCSWSKPRSYPTWGGLSLEVLGTGGALDLDAFRQRLHILRTHSGSLARPPARNIRPPGS